MKVVFLYYEPKTETTQSGGFCFGSFPLLCSNQRQSRARGSSNEVGTDGENAVLLAKFGRSRSKAILLNLPPRRQIC